MASHAVRAQYQAISNIKFNIIYICFLSPSLPNAFWSSHSLNSHIQNCSQFIKMQRKFLHLFFSQTPTKILRFTQLRITGYPSILFFIIIALSLMLAYHSSNMRENRYPPIIIPEMQDASSPCTVAAYIRHEIPKTDLKLIILPWDAESRVSQSSI